MTDQATPIHSLSYHDEVRVVSMLDVVEVFTEDVNRNMVNDFKQLVDQARLDPSIAREIKRQVEQVQEQAAARLSNARRVLQLLRVYHSRQDPLLLQEAEQLVHDLTVSKEG